MSAGARRLILGIIVTFSLILALICVTQPFNPLAQFIFLMLLWGVALIVRRMPGRFSALMLIVLSLTVSCRYIWWRYTSTLNWDDPVSLVCGLILLFAETYAWIVLVLGYFQVVWYAESSAGAIAERYVAVVRRWISLSRLTTKISTW
ncbi:hypothetical protein AB2I50_12845 [Escherichia coli]